MLVGGVLGSAGVLAVSGLVGFAGVSELLEVSGLAVSGSIGVSGLAVSVSASFCPEAMRAATSYVVSSLPRAERSALAGRSRLKKLLVRWRLRAAERATSLLVPTGCRSASPTRLSDDSRAATAKPMSIAMTAFVAVVCRRGEVALMAASELEIDERGHTFGAELIHNEHPDAEASSQSPNWQAGKLHLNIG